MCGIFGILSYGNTGKNYGKLINSLARNSAERGTHATGIAYNLDDKLVIYKKPLPAYKLDFKHIDGVKAIIGHTRHATQGDYKLNYNNHPFKGDYMSGSFALAHNGVLWNDNELRKSFKLPHSKIKTDSYVIVQLLEKKGCIDFDSLASVSEELEGSFTYTVLDSADNLYIVKGDNPVSIIHFEKLQLFAYASTDDILTQSIIEAGLLPEMLRKEFSYIKLSDGDILKITAAGKTEKSSFSFRYQYGGLRWYDFGDDWSFSGADADAEYYDELISTAQYMGYDRKDIDELRADGFSLDDIADFLYSGELV